MSAEFKYDIQLRDDRDRKVFQKIPEQIYIRRVFRGFHRQVQGKRSR